MYIAEQLFPELAPQYFTRVYFGLGVCRTRVKIGLTGRPNGHRGGEMHFNELCSVPGDRLVEQRYRREYVTERIGKTEWHELSDQLLMDLIIMCVQQGRHKSVEILRDLILARLRRRAAA